MHRLRRIGTSVVVFVVTVAGLLVAHPTAAPAHGSGVEFLYGPADDYLDNRVQEVTDTSDVLLGMEFETTVNGTVSGARICLDLTPTQVNGRLPLYAYLWSADGTLLRVGAASEGISHASPCFYDIFFSPVSVTADERYVVGFWIRGGQYSYVPSGFDTDISNATVGHLTAPSNANSTVGAGNGLYVYTSDFGMDTPFPTESWQNSDYLISPRFTPAPHWPLTRAAGLTRAASPTAG